MMVRMIGSLEVHRDTGEGALLGMSWVEARLVLPGAVFVVVVVAIAKQFSTRI